MICDFEPFRTQVLLKKRDIIFKCTFINLTVLKSELVSFPDMSVNQNLFGYQTMCKYIMYVPFPDVLNRN